MLITRRDQCKIKNEALIYNVYFADKFDHNFGCQVVTITQLNSLCMLYKLVRDVYTTLHYIRLQYITTSFFSQNV